MYPTSSGTTCKWTCYQMSINKWSVSCIICRMCSLCTPSSFRKTKYWLCDSYVCLYYICYYRRIPQFDCTSFVQISISRVICLPSNIVTLSACYEVCTRFVFLRCVCFSFVCFRLLEWRLSISPISRETPLELWNQGAISIRKTVLPGMAIPMLKIRRPNGRLIFNMEIAIRR